MCDTPYFKKKKFDRKIFQKFFFEKNFLIEKKFSKIFFNNFSKFSKFFKVFIDLYIFHEIWADSIKNTSPVKTIKDINFDKKSLILM